MNKRKKRAAKRIYLVREIRELWSRLASGATLRINKIRAHCLDCHDEDFSSAQVRDALWSFYAVVNKENGGENFYSAIPESAGTRFVGLVKIGDDAEGRTRLEAYRKATLDKDFSRIAGHKKYIDTDVRKRLMSSRVAERIIAAAGLSPLAKELPAHE